MQLGLLQGRLNLDLPRLRGDDTAEQSTCRAALCGWWSLASTTLIPARPISRPNSTVFFAGSARFAGGGIDQTVKAGERLVLSGTDTLSAAMETATEDDFSKWCRSHDYHPDQLAAPYHVSPAMTGYEELDAYGQWATATKYGNVWYPQSVAADWSPYREGHRSEPHQPGFGRPQGWHVSASNASMGGIAA